MPKFIASVQPFQREEVTNPPTKFRIYTYSISDQLKSTDLRVEPDLVSSVYRIINY